MKFITTRFFAFGLLILIIGKSNAIKAQKISPYLIGNNAWYDGASLNNFWDDMAIAKFQSIRIGGNAAEGYGSNYAKYITLIDGIRLAKAEPIVQVSHTFTTQQAIDFITYINVTKGKKIKLWNISNEPDLASNNFGNAAAVSTYIKRIASALKSVDSTIVIMGPETSWYQNSAYMTPLIGGSADITGKDAAGHYYIDVVTFHKYMFTEISGLESDVNNLLAKFNTVNAKRPADKQLSWGLTEFNTSYDNSLNTSPDQDVWSFHAGQLFAEIYGLGMRKGAFAMNAWSMFEGPDRSGTDLSLFDKDFKGRSNYYHCLILGQNMKKNYVTTTDNQSNVVVIPMADTSGVAVMIVNKNRTAGYNYTLRLDNGTFMQSNALQIKVNAGINQEISGSITKHATQMLVFDNSGTLVKRYTYTSLDADGRGEPLVEYITGDPAPLVSLTSPTVNTTISLKSSVSLTADATDNGIVQKVEFTANGALIGTSKTPPYSFIWTPTTAGTYTVSARAFDDLGGVGFATGTSVLVEKVYNYIPIPATIEAEGYDEMSGIQLEPTTDTGGGQNIGYCDPGDWLDYTINVPTTGQYNVEMRVASLNKTGAFSLKNGTTTLATFALPNGTGGWQTWTTLSKTVSLKAGNQTLRLAITGKDININWIKVSNLTSISTPKLNQLEIFPNPCSIENFSLKLTGLTEIEPVDIKIYSISGNTIYSQKAVLAKSGTVEIVVQDKKRLSSGVYIVSVQSKSFKTNRKLILKD